MNIYNIIRTQVLYIYTMGSLTSPKQFSVTILSMLLNENTKKKRKNEFKVGHPLNK